MPRRDDKTLDLFEDYKPPEVVQRFAEKDVAGCNASARICRAMKAALDGHDRTEIAERMSDYLGVDFSKNMLDAYVSEARATHQINLIRFAALVHATGDMRLLSVLPEIFGYIVVHGKYEKMLQAGIARENLKALNETVKLLEAQAKREAAGQ